MIDAIFAEVNTTNIRKSFYKKKDLISGLPEVTATVEEPIFDSHGEELMSHTTKNTMNELILTNAKLANGKRTRSEAGVDETNPEGQEP